MSKQPFKDIFDEMQDLYKELLKIDNNIKMLEVEDMPPSLGGPRLPYFYKEKERVTGNIEEILMNFKEKGALS